MLPLLGWGALMHRPELRAWLPGCSKPLRHRKAEGKLWVQPCGLRGDAALPAQRLVGVFMFSYQCTVGAVRIEPELLGLPFADLGGGQPVDGLYG